MEFYSINPYNGKQVGQYTGHTSIELENILDKSAEAFKTWSREPLSYRTGLIQKAGEVLRENVEEYAQMITSEMGKPISDSRACLLSTPDAADDMKCLHLCVPYAFTTHST